MAALSPPKKVTLAFVHRRTGAIRKKRQFEFRNEHRALIKMWAWIVSYMDEYPPSEYRLMAMVHEGPRPEFIVSKLREWGIQVLEPEGAEIEVYR